jgi:hypothetical protein
MQKSEKIGYCFLSKKIPAINQKNPTVFHQRKLRFKSFYIVASLKLNDTFSECLNFQQHFSH